MSEVKTLLVDIETTPLIAYTWGPKWETNLIEVTEQSKILSYSAKWLGGTHITKGLIDFKNYKRKVVDDNLITQDLIKLFNEADVVVTQNGISFDIKVIKARCAFHGIMPPSPFKSIDTKVEAKKCIRLPSYSLNDMCDYFGLGNKMKHDGFELWKKCVEGDKDAWAKMKKYNKQDVLLLEALYLKLRPYMKTHPNLCTIFEGYVCPRCGSDRLHAQGFVRTTTAFHRRFQCQSCGSWGKEMVKERRLEVLTNNI